MSRTRFVAGLAGVLSLALVLTLSGQPASADPVSGPSGPGPAPDRSTPVGAVAAKATTQPPPAVEYQPAAVWPVGGSAVVPVAPVVGATTAGSVSRRATVGVVAVGGLPVSVRQAPGERASGSVARPDGQPAASGPASVRIGVTGRAAAEALGVRGVVFTLSRTDGVAVPARVALDVEYGAFREAYGGDYAGRLSLVSLPGCALSTPRVPGCAAATPVPGVRNVATSWTLGVDSIDVAGAGAESVYAVTPAAAGGGGTFAATDLRQSWSWASGGQGGEFTLSYPFRAPPAPGGLEPKLAIQYSSGSIDSMTTAGNGQTSMIGEGWSLPVGFVEESFKSCALDGAPGAQDFCYLSERVVTLAWGGRSSKLIKDRTTGLWRSLADDGLRIEVLTDSTVDNGDHEREYWRITTMDGTQYFFGRHRRYPGDPQVTNSVQNVPVFGNHAGEPCHSTDGFAASWCQQGYRWNLDYVVDPRGNSMTYFWTTQTNWYGLNNDSQLQPYDRYGYPDRAEYGTRTGTEGVAAAPFRMVFGDIERCFSNCGGGAGYFDVPFDQVCHPGQRPCANKSPTFFTDRRHHQVRAEVFWSGGYRTVDEWRLRQRGLHSGDWIPPAGNDTNPNLWLDTVQHVGFDGAGVAAVEPETAFWPTLMPNRVRWGADIGVAPYAHGRIAVVRNGYGGETSVQVYPEDCTATTPPPDQDNNMWRCFPQFHRPLVADPAWVWFHKYVVSKVTERDLLGGSPDEQYEYIYSSAGSSSGVMWHFDNNETAPMELRNWSDWRGYSTVTTVHGTIAGQQTTTVDRYNRGMHGDRTDAGWNTRSVMISDALNAGVPDEPAMAGALRQHTTQDGPSGPALVMDIHQPVVTEVGSRPAPGPDMETQKAYRVRNLRSTKRVALDGGAWRETRQQYFYDAYGLPTSVADWGGPGRDDDVCTDIYYTNRDLVRYFIDYRGREVVHNCEPDRTDEDFFKATEYYHDNAASPLAIPVQGLLTVVAGGISRTAGVWSWVTLRGHAYDQYGRVTGTYDGLGRTTTTAYQPAGGGPTTSMVVTNPARHATTTTFDPVKGVTTAIVDPNNKVTSLAHDPLNRLVKVWLPGRSTSQAANVEYVYVTPDNAPTYITSKKLGPNGNQISAYHLFDGRLRARQTQSPAPQANGGRMVADTGYDERGLVAKESVFWNSGAAPAGSLLSFADAEVPQQHRYGYDNVARQTVAALWSNNTPKWQTSTAYGGDWTAVTPPAGGTATRTIVNADGEPIALRQYLTPTPTGDQYQTTSYGYDRLGRRTSVTDPAGNVWTTGYDGLDRMVSSNDPDKGAVSNTYDKAGQLLTTTSAVGTLAYAYDSLGRTRQVWRGAVDTGDKLAEWTYDTLANGTVVKGQLSTATRLHTSGQYKTLITGYDDAYRPLGATVRVPVGQGLLTGDWTIGTTYHVDGSPASASYPAAAGLPAETVNYGYDNTGHLLTTTGLDTYLSGTSYHAWGDVYQQLLGTNGKRVRLTTAVDQASGRLLGNRVQTENPTTPDTFDHALDEEYGYDPAGNIRSITEFNGARGLVDSQCFNYDPLGQLTEAWQTFGSCQPTPSQAVIGGPDGYWTSYTYTPIGNRRTETKHTPTGDTTRDYRYPTPGAGAVRPHAVTSIVSTGATTSTDNYSYDDIGNTISRKVAGKPDQTLTWDAEGRLDRVVDNTGTTRYVYDATGARLLETRPDGSATLYLPGSEVVRDTGGTLTATRHYGVASRTADAGLTWLAADHHGTAQLAVDATTLARTRRKTDPFGNPRGDDPAWPNNRGYVNGVRDHTGLTHLGAREYEPTTGRFISVDPIMDIADPLQMNGYAYANSNPVTFSDPSGLIIGGGQCLEACGSEDDRVWYKPLVKAAKAKSRAAGGHHQSAPSGSARQKQIDEAEAAANKAKQIAVDAGKALLKIAMDELGVTAALDCVTKGDIGACVEIGVTALLSFAGGLVTKLVAKYGWRWGKLAGLLSKVRGLADQASGAIKTWWSKTKLARELRRRCSSFVPGTGVLMADGSVIPIEDVDVGDLVFATDPETGRAEVRPVLALIGSVGFKNLVEVAVADGDRVGIVVATDSHPFWVADVGEWLAAADLRPGNLLRTSAGTYAQVTAVRTWQEYRRVHNLTVADIHTYNVLAGGTPILVHNDNNLPGNTKKLFNIAGSFNGRIDRFNYGGQAFFEIHVFDGQIEVGIWGSDGWIGKHKHSADMELSRIIENRLKGVSIAEMQRSGRLPLGADVKGDAWKLPHVEPSC